MGLAFQKLRQTRARAKTWGGADCMIHRVRAALTPEGRIAMRPYPLPTMRSGDNCLWRRHSGIRLMGRLLEEANRRGR